MIPKIDVKETIGSLVNSLFDVKTLNETFERVNTGVEQTKIALSRISDYTDPKNVYFDIKYYAEKAVHSTFLEMGKYFLGERK
jgi:hypothetical protein